MVAISRWKDADEGFNVERVSDYSQLAHGPV